MDMAPDAFARQLDYAAEALGLDNRALSQRFQVSVPTVERWRAGLAVPQPLMRRLVLEFLEASR